MRRDAGGGKNRGRRAGKKIQKASNTFRTKNRQNQRPGSSSRKGPGADVAQLQKKYSEKVFKFLKLFVIIKLEFVKNRRNLSGEIPYFG